MTGRFGLIGRLIVGRQTASALALDALLGAVGET